MSKSIKTLEHRCGVQGFDGMKGDVCPACDARTKAMSELLPRQAWAVVGPDGAVHFHTIRGTQDAAWEPFELLCPRRDWERDGYTIQPVTITSQQAGERTYAEGLEDAAKYFEREGKGRFEVDGNWLAKTIRALTQSAAREGQGNGL